MEKDENWEVVERLVVVEKMGVCVLRRSERLWRRMRSGKIRLVEKDERVMVV